jgi:hypothetical protein
LCLWAGRPGADQSTGAVFGSIFSALLAYSQYEGFCISCLGQEVVAHRGRRQ